MRWISPAFIFQPTLPLRGATMPVCFAMSLTSLISTHAPPAGSDRARRYVAHGLRNFNPRSPCGERRRRRSGDRRGGRFQPTLPLRGATALIQQGDVIIVISTHAPPAGSDRISQTSPCASTDFNPRSPCGERPVGRPHPESDKLISTHAPPAGSDVSSATPPPHFLDFNPRSPCGERPTRQEWRGR